MAESGLNAAKVAGLLEPLTALVAEAAAKIRGIPYSSVQAKTKADRSSVTAADLASEAILLSGLARIAPGIAVVSEERVANEAPPQLGGNFFLVDPLDGTREFLAGRDEFTVNLALIADGQSLLGIIAAPARNLLWRGLSGHGAQRFVLDNGKPRDGTPIRTRPVPAEGAIATISRSHMESRTEAFLTQLPVSERIAAGSAIKFCMIADGKADLYPRLSETSEWDLAAGHALVLAAGGAVTAPDGGRLSYGKTPGQFLVPGFIACGDPAWALSHIPSH